MLSKQSGVNSAPDSSATTGSEPEDNQIHESVMIIGDGSVINAPTSSSTPTTKPDHTQQNNGQLTAVNKTGEEPNPKTISPTTSPPHGSIQHGSTPTKLTQASTMTADNFSSNSPPVLTVGQHQAPPYRFFLNPFHQYHIISAHHPSPANIRQVQHLYDTCFPLNYSPAFYNTLSTPGSNKYQSQTFVLTSTDDPHLVDPTSIAVVDSTKPVTISGTKVNFKSLNVKSCPVRKVLYEEDDNHHHHDATAAANDEQPPQRITNLQIKLHPSILEPLPFNPLTTNLDANTNGDKSNEHDHHHNPDSDLENPIPDAVKARARHYSADFKRLTIPEYISSEHAESSAGASLDDIDSNPPPQSSYLHTASSTQFLHSAHAINTGPAINHQVIGSWVVRPSAQTLTSLLPDLLHQTKSSPIVKGLMSISSWFGGSSSSSTTPPPRQQQTPPALAFKTTTAEEDAYHHHIMRSAYLCTLSIAPQFSGSGLGSLLLFNCVEFCIKHYNISYLYLHVLESNKKAVDLYRRFGFVIEDTKPGYFYTLPHSLFGADPTVPLEQYLKKVTAANPAAALDESALTFGLPLLPVPVSDGSGEATDHVILRSYRLPEEESGDAVYMYLSIDLWKSSQRAKCVQWLQNILNLTP